MNKEVVTISTAVLSAALTRGGAGVLLETASNTTKMGVNLVACGGFAYLSSKVTGNDTKAAALRGSAFGAAVAHGLEFFKAVGSTEKATAKLATTSKINTFLQHAAGLNASTEGLAGYIDAAGNYHEDGLNGYIDARGNLVEEEYQQEPQLLEYEEYQSQNEGLQAAIDIDGNIIM